MGAPNRIGHGSANRITRGSASRIALTALLVVLVVVVVRALGAGSPAGSYTQAERSTARTARPAKGESRRMTGRP